MANGVPARVFVRPYPCLLLAAAAAAVPAKNGKDAGTGRAHHMQDQTCSRLLHREPWPVLHHHWPQGSCHPRP